VQATLPDWPSANSADETRNPASGDQHLLSAAASLRQLLEDKSIPDQVRADLEQDYAQVEAMCDKLTDGDIHIAAFGEVSSGKSSLLNALLGEARFEVSPLHGMTQRSEIARWRESDSGGVHLIDTPGINELAGEQREQMAFEVAGRCDLVLLVADGDLSQVETEALRLLAAQQRPLILVLNKSDLYTDEESDLLLASLKRHSEGIVPAENVLSAAAAPRPQTVIRVANDGSETSEELARNPDVTQLTERIWVILEAEGKTLAALNAVLFAGQLSDQVAERITAVRRELAERITRSYSLAKGVAVAFNPIPVADLLAAASIDVALVLHLSRVYGLPMSRREGGKLLATIAAQLAALMGAVWGVHLVSSALKGISMGLSVTVTAGAQGALAYYATYLVGRAAESYLVQGKSWGPEGPKRAVKGILDSLDRGSILIQAREDILASLKRSA
jgi:small GTP-binding protein